MVTQFPVHNGDVIDATDVNSAYYQAALAGTLNFASITVATASATLIKAANSSRKTFLGKNYTGGTVYLGGSAVTSASGYKLTVGQDMLLNNKDDIYGIADSSTADFRYLETQ